MSSVFRKKWTEEIPARDHAGLNTKLAPQQARSEVRLQKQRPATSSFLPHLPVHI